MSQIMPRRRAYQPDPLTEHLKNLNPEQVDALQMMRGVYSNQVELAAAHMSQLLHTFDADNDVYELAESVASNTVPRLDAVLNELENQEL